MADYTPTTGVAWNITGGVSTIILEVDPPVPAVSFGAQHDFDSNLYFDISVDGDVRSYFSSAADVISTGVITQSVAGSVAGLFAAGADSIFDVGFEEPAVASFSVAADTTASLAGMHYVPSVGVDAYFSTGLDYTLGLLSGVEEGHATAHFSHPADYWVSMVRAESEVAFMLAEVSGFYGYNLNYDYVYESEAAFFKSVAAGLVSYSVGFPTLTHVGNVSASFSAGHDVQFEDRNPEVFAACGFVAASQVVIGLVEEGTAAASFSASAGGQYPAYHTATVAGGAFSASVTHDAESNTTDNTGVVAVFGVGGTYIFNSGDYSTEGVPGRGASTAGSWTETDQDGGWTENVGHAMARGGERGAYTGDTSYLYDKKPNVFDGQEGSPVRGYGYGFYALVSDAEDTTYGFITEAGSYGFSTDSTSDGYAEITEEAEGKPTSTITDESKPTQR